MFPPTALPAPAEQNRYALRGIPKESEGMNDYFDYLHALNQQFTTRFQTVYRACKKPKKTRILQCLAAVYRRWYYSSLVDDAVLSPAYLIDLLNQECNRPPMLTPLIGYRKRITADFQYTHADYRLDSHPVIDDLKIFVQFCTPDIDLTDDDQIRDAHMQQLLALVSICDPFYIEFLLNISVQLNIVRKIPSIYSNKAQATNQFLDIFSMPPAQLLAKMIDAAVQISASFIAHLIPTQPPFFDRACIYRMLREPIPTDHILHQLYEIMGAAVNSRLPYESEMDFGFEIDDDDNAALLDGINNVIMSGTFLFGLILDKFFFTPFGHYLKLIRPLYVLHYDFNSEINYILETIDEDEGLLVSLYAPCSTYTITPLGAAYFEQPQEDTVYPKDVGIPFHTLFRAVLDQANQPKQQLELLEPFMVQPQNRTKTIYEIKIRLFDQKYLWKNIEIPSGISLHNLYLEVCYVFGFDANSEYSFFPDTSENQFAEYTSRHHPRRTKKTNDVTLFELDFRTHHKFILKLFNTYDPYNMYNDLFLSKEIKLELELVTIKERNADRFYPRVSRESAAFKDMKMDLDF